MKYPKEKIADQKANLLRYLKPGTTVYTVLRHVSKSGMKRNLDVFVIVDNEPLRITYGVAVVCGYSLDDSEIVARGCGMDMGFEVVYNLGMALWENGTPDPHGIRNGIPDNNGGYALKHRWL